MNISAVTTNKFVNFGNSYKFNRFDDERPIEGQALEGRYERSRRKFEALFETLFGGDLTTSALLQLISRDDIPVSEEDEIFLNEMLKKLSANNLPALENFYACADMEDFSENFIEILEAKLQTLKSTPIKSIQSISSNIQPIQPAKSVQIRNINDMLAHKDFTAKMKDKNGNEVLHLCALSDEDNILDLISKAVLKGADVNAKNNDDITPLMIASKIGDAEKIKKLIACGADTTLKDKTGKKAIDYTDNIKIKRILKKYDTRSNV